MTHQQPTSAGLPTCATAGTAWYVVYCQPAREHYTALTLREQLGLTVYLPEVRSYFRGQVQPAPLFPRYLFAQANLQQVPPSRINATPGVVRLIAFDGKPQAMPAAIIEDLHTKVEETNHRGGLLARTIQPGDTVQIKAGPLVGLEAVFIGPATPSERVQVLLELMGRLNQVELERRMIEPGAEPPPTRRPRRTRGKGRKITTKT
ncbi:MAG: hypothetical protein HC893_07930 [Chloroflexaceae bacterium]|nr:hypothetical protein [Chloroflexaceae bacterium]NJO04538.1 hypothetical protein [Chloroflexaceae bacterium]